MGMNLADVGKVLAKASAFDGRKMSEAQAMACLEVLAPYDLADCLAAVTEHFATSDAYLMPVHIRRIVERKAHHRRQVAAHNAAVDAIGALEASNSQREMSPRVAELVQRLRDSLPDTTAEDVFRRAEWVDAERERAREARVAHQNPAYSGQSPAPPQERVCGTDPQGHADHTYEWGGNTWWCPGDGLTRFGDDL